MIDFGEIVRDYFAPCKSKWFWIIWFSTTTVLYLILYTKIHLYLAP
jgi:hypothetical protein